MDMSDSDGGRRHARCGALTEGLQRVCAMLGANLVRRRPFPRRIPHRLSTPPVHQDQALGSLSEQVIMSPSCRGRRPAPVQVQLHMAAFITPRICRRPPTLDSVCYWSSDHGMVGR